jgi:hypothetical protein
MMKYLVGGIVFVLVALGAYYAWDMYSAAQVPPPPPPPQAPTTSTYATSTFSITYPSGFAVDEAYSYNAFEGKPIAGVKFSIPTSMAEGTNLSQDSGISVEWLPRAQNCTADIYLLADVKANAMIMGSTTYSVATSTDAGAGNIYEEAVYAIAGSKPCTAVRYFIHSMNIGNFPTEGEEVVVREFDRAALLRQFDSIRDALVLTPTP